MGVQNITHDARLQQWEKIVRECRSSGKPINAWCRENSINYYRWQQRVSVLTFMQGLCSSLSQNSNINMLTYK